jgi:FkbM family methyltransferase
VKKVIKSVFRSLGIEIKRVEELSQKILKPDTMISAMNRMKNLGIDPSTIIDLGAAEGSWSVKAMNFWPKARYLLFEPLMERKTILEKLQTVHKNVHVVYSAAGKDKGNIDFCVTDDLDGSGFYEEHKTAKIRKIDVTTIDEEVKRAGLKAPFFIKFDTHGFEVPILEGAGSTLRETEMIVMECYGFRISKNCLLLHEMCVYMEKLDFRMADIVEVMRRPGDEFFWQCDVFFLRSSHPSFLQNSYKQ